MRLAEMTVDSCQVSGSACTSLPESGRLESEIAFLAERVLMNLSFAKPDPGVSGRIVGNSETTSRIDGASLNWR